MPKREMYAFLGKYLMEAGFHQVRVGVYLIGTGFHQVETGFDLMESGFHQVETQSDQISLIDCLMQFGCDQIEFMFDLMEFGFFLRKFGFDLVESRLDQMFGLLDLPYDRFYPRRLTSWPLVWKLSMTDSSTTRKGRFKIRNSKDDPLFGMGLKTPPPS